MRDIVLAAVLFGLLPVIIWRPWIGMLVWVWVSTMSPHRMTYGFMLDAPVAQIIALAILVGLLFSKEHRQLIFPPPVTLMIVFTGWMCITYPFSLVPTSENAAQLTKVLKIMVMNVVLMIPLFTRRHVDYLVAAFVVSIGFFGVKGGIFAITTGGAYQVRGGGGFIEPNNELALALVMTIPLMNYFAMQASKRVWKLGIYGVMFLTAVAAISSHSRGGLLAIIAMGLAVIVRSPNRLKMLIPLIATAFFVAVLMPDAYWERMNTMKNYQEDESAMGRINAWIMAWRIATDHFFGGGFVLEEQSIFDRYAPNPDFIAVAHSVYFQVLGQHGFVGLTIYLLMWASVFLTCFWIHKNADQESDRQLVRMIEVSLIGFFVGGTFLNLAYFDGPYTLMIALVVLRYKIMGNRRLAKVSKVSVPSSSVDRLDGVTTRKR